MAGRAESRPLSNSPTERPNKKALSVRSTEGPEKANPDCGRKYLMTSVTDCNSVSQTFQSDSYFDLDYLWVDDLCQREQLSKENPLLIPPENLENSGVEDLNLIHNSNKCPLLNSDQCLLGYSKEEELLEPVAFEAERIGMSKMAWKLRHCLADSVILENSTEIKAFPIPCNHKLCPVCSKRNAWQLKKRLVDKIEPGYLFLTLTWRTSEDRYLSEYIDRGKVAFRKLTQNKGKKSEFLPLRKGYFWRLELTPGKGFHPHFHCVVDSKWIDVDQLENRWKQCLGASAGKCWISYIKQGNQQDAAAEVAKYLSKSIIHFDSSRWWFLDDALNKIRTYGAGGTLKLPPARVPKGYSIIGFLSDFTPDHVSFSRRGADENVIEGLIEEGALDRLRPDCYVQRKLKKKYQVK